MEKPFCDYCGKTACMETRTDLPFYHHYQLQYQVQNPGVIHSVCIECRKLEVNLIKIRKKELPVLSEESLRDMLVKIKNEVTSAQKTIGPDSDQAMEEFPKELFIFD